MSILFNNKYRVPTARLQNWNYANEAMYFITICTKNKENYFGKIVLETQCIETQCIASLRPTEIGQMAHSEWYKTIELRPDMNLELGEFVVMPNHIHGIVIIGANEYNTQRRNATHRVSTNANDIAYKNQFAPQYKTYRPLLGVINLP